MKNFEYTNKHGQELLREKKMQAVTDIRHKRRGWLQQMAQSAQTGILIPQGLVIGFLLFIIAQTGAGIWWAAKIDTSLQYSVQQGIQQKSESELKFKDLEKDLKEVKEKLAVQEISNQLLQVKLGIMEGKKK
jgi:hypothetical protein